MLDGDLSKAKAFALVAATGVLGYKIVVTPFVLTVDFPTLLSLLLAIFSVFLSALFYFKATETSNTFYDNTYKFTQDIAALLVKIESGFGEKLRHLDEGYSSMRDKLDKFPGKYEIEEAKSEIQKEEEGLRQKLEEKDKMIDDLAIKAHLKDEEREKFKNELNNMITELNTAQSEITFLRDRIAKTERQKLSSSDFEIDIGMKNFIFNNVFKIITPQIFWKYPSSQINRKFKDRLDMLPDGFLADLHKYGMIDESKDLTRKGITIFKGLAELALDTQQLSS
jgi:hypothetical protein